MRYFRLTFLVLSLTVGLSACIPQEPQVTSYEENFKAIWKIINDRYCFLEEKGIDWDQVYTKYDKHLKKGNIKDDIKFFELMSQMLNELRDGHVNLVAPFNRSSYRGWQGDPTEGLNIYARKSFFPREAFYSGGMSYQVYNLVSKEDPKRKSLIGYISYGSFSSSLGNMDIILSYFEETDGFILDLRGNSGGYLSHANSLLSRFFDKKTLVGYSRHKVSPKYNDFSDPTPIYVTPHKGTRWTKRPVVIIQDRGCYSATNDFLYKVALAKNVTRIGLRSGGGTGLPATQEIPNGWVVRFSSVQMLDTQKRSMEEGIEPDITVKNRPYKIDPGAKDEILHRALEVLTEKIEEYKNKPK